MKRNSHLKQVFVQPLSWISLGILSVIGISPLVLAQDTSLPTVIEKKSQQLSEDLTRRQERRQQSSPSPKPAHSPVPDLPDHFPLNDSSDDWDHFPSHSGHYFPSHSGYHFPSADPLNNFPLTPEPSVWPVEQLQDRIEPQQRAQQQRQQEWEQQTEELSQRIEEWSNVYSANNYDGAEATFLAIVSKYPDSPTEDYAKVYYDLVNKLHSQGKVETAVIVYQQAIRLDSRHAEAHNAIGEIRAKQGQMEEAIAQYQQALSIKPEYADALKNLGMVLWIENKQTEAVATLEKAKNLFKEQGKAREADQVEQLLQAIQFG